MGVVWGSCNTTPQRSPPRAGTALRMSSVSGHPWPEGTPSPHGVPHGGCRMGARRGCSQAGGCGHSPAPAPPSTQLLHLTSLTSATGKEKVEAAGAEVLPCTFWGAARSPPPPPCPGGRWLPNSLRGHSSAPPSVTSTGTSGWCWGHLLPCATPRPCLHPRGHGHSLGTRPQFGDMVPAWGHHPISRDTIHLHPLPAATSPPHLPEQPLTPQRGSPNSSPSPPFARSPLPSPPNPRGRARTPLTPAPAAPPRPAVPQPGLPPAGCPQSHPLLGTPGSGR